MQPCLTTVKIEDISFNAYASQFGIFTPHDGMPQMGATLASIEVHADMHDTVNLPFTSVQKLFHMANIVTRDKIKDIKLEYWSDESRQDALATYTFRGWISSFYVLSGAGSNHTLVLHLQPALSSGQFIDIRIGN